MAPPLDHITPVVCTTTAAGFATLFQRTIPLVMLQRFSLQLLLLYGLMAVVGRIGCESGVVGLCRDFSFTDFSCSDGRKIALLAPVDFVCSLPHVDMGCGYESQLENREVRILFRMIT